MSDDVYKTIYIGRATLDPDFDPETAEIIELPPLQFGDIYQWNPILVDKLVYEPVEEDE